MFGFGIGFNGSLERHEQRLQARRDIARERRVAAAVHDGRARLVERIIDREVQQRARQLDDAGTDCLVDDWRALDRRVVSSSQAARTLLSRTPAPEQPAAVRALSQLVVATGLDADTVCCLGATLPLAGLRRELADEALATLGRSAAEFADSGLGVTPTVAPPAPAHAPPARFSARWRERLIRRWLWMDPDWDR